MSCELQLVEVWQCSNTVYERKHSIFAFQLFTG